MEMKHKEMDELVENLSQQILRDECRPGMLNPGRLQQIRFAEKMLRRMAAGTDIKITVTLHEPFNSMGSITLEGESLEFMDCKCVGSAIAAASNVEIYATLDGKVRLTLTFHSLIKSIKTK